MDIISLLRINGPMLSSKIKENLMKDGCTDEVARQRISRIAKQTKKLSINFFPKRNSFLYLDGQENTSQYFENLIKALKETNSVHYYAIVALAAWGGKVSIEKFKVLSGAPQHVRNIRILIICCLN